MTSLRLRPIALLASLALAAGCAESHSHDDDDASTPPPRDCSACDGDHACVRGVCIATCGLDPAAIDAEIAPDLTPLGHVCVVLPDGPLAARPAGPTSIDLLGATLTPPATPGGEATVAITRAGVDWASGAILVGAGGCSTTFSPERGDLTLSLSDSMGLSPAGVLPHFGVHARLFSDTESVHADVAFVVDEERCAFTEARMQVYGGATLLTEDPSELLAQGVDDDGLRMGLFRGDVELAHASAIGTVARFEGGVIAPIGTGHGAVSLVYYAADAVRGGPYPLRSDVVSGWESWPIEFVVLEGRGLVGRAITSPDDTVLLYAARLEGGALVLEEGTFFASERFAQVVPVHGSRRVVLAHDAGLLIVE